MKVSTLQYINDIQGYIKALFEEAIGLPIDEMEADWKEFINTKTSDSVSKMTMAYELSQPYKEELPFYGLLCMKLCFCLYRQDAFKKELYEQAIQYLHHPELLETTKKNQEYFLRRLTAERTEGIQPEAMAHIQGVERLNSLMGDGQWNFHDGVIHSMEYDRENEKLTIVIDTYCRTWSESGDETYLVPFHFSDSITIEGEIECGNDYIWTSRIYLLNDWIYVEFESAHLKISSKKLSIGEINTIKHSKKKRG